MKTQLTNRNKNYLNFDKSRMVNLEYSLNREILRTNRKGAYHCTTIAECNTRKQHGLLVMPVPKLGDTNHVLLSSFSETIIQYGAEFNLGINKYDGAFYSPQGHKYIREFTCDIIPKITYRVGGVVFSKEKMFSLEDNTIYIRYTLLDAHSPTTIRFSPFLAFREINELTVQNTIANHGYKEEENGISMCMYTGYPTLYMQFSKAECNFTFNPTWNKGVEYARDMEEDLPYKEDLYVPGYFEMPIKKGESIIFAASDMPVEVDELASLFEEGIKQRTPRSSFYNCLKNSGKQFYYRPTPNETYLLNNYPWGHVDARSQFMALEGLTISVDRPDVCEEVLDTAIPVVKAFMEGRTIRTPIKDIDAPDVLFWMLRSIKSLYDYDPTKFKEKYALFVHDVVQFILEDKHPRLKVTENKLLYTDGRYQAASWMDGRINGQLVVPRTGYLIEINTFWYNSILLSKTLAEKYEHNQDDKMLEFLAEKIKESFVNTFLNEAGYLYDYVDGAYRDWTVRPNMLYTISGAYPLLDKRESKKALDYATKELLMHRGLRTKSPQSGSFSPRYEGSRDDKIYASFNGVSRAWLIAPYLEAYIKVFQQSGLAFLDRVLSGIEEEMANNCIGSISEMYDGSMPSLGHGAVSSAIDVAGVLRVLKFKQIFENKY